MFEDRKSAALGSLLTFALGVGLLAAPAPQSRPPNIIFILADDLGYGELGCYGQTRIKTPALDRMAREGMRFTDFYSGNAVCAPSRCVLLTGKHAGHAWIRDNREVLPEGQAPIPSDAVTVAEALRERGYATAAVGKWGLGAPGSTGDPNRHGFDLYYGVNCQRVAHNHYPTYLYRNSDRVGLSGNNGTLKGKQYVHDLLEKESLEFIRSHAQKPFFLYLPFLVPHVSLQVPEDSLAEYQGLWEETPYDGNKGYLPHPTPRAAHAAMITRMDRSVGRILELLTALKIDGDTLVLFSSDNGSVDAAGGHDLAFFQANGSLRSEKGYLYEGGIRVPCIARWPGHVPAGSESRVPAASYDLFPTFCALAGASVPQGVDGRSLVPVLTGSSTTSPHEFLYWEFSGYGGQQAVRMGDWKGVRVDLQKRRTALELYDLSKDPGEKENVADRNPQVATRILEIMKREHSASALFPILILDEAK
jgi:arylsulfatase